MQIFQGTDMNDLYYFKSVYKPTEYETESVVLGWFSVGLVFETSTGQSINKLENGPSSYREKHLFRVGFVEAIIFVYKYVNQCNEK